MQKKSNPRNSNNFGLFLEKELEKRVPRAPHSNMLCIIFHALFGAFEVQLSLSLNKASKAQKVGSQQNFTFAEDNSITFVSIS